MAAELVLKNTYNLSKSLQHVSISAAEGQQVSSMNVATTISMRNDEHFKILGHLILRKAEEGASVNHSFLDK